MAINHLAFLEPQAMRNCTIIGIAFLDVGMSRRKMCGDEAEAGVMIVETYTYRALVPGHSSKPSLHR